MAIFKTILLTVTILVATSSAAPKKLGLKIPDECKGKGFCPIKPEGYDEMEEILDKLLTDKFIAQNIGDRIGDGSVSSKLSPEKDWHNCPYVTTTESMYSYSDSNETDADYIIQHKFLYQPIEVVTCANDKIPQNSAEECFQHLGLSKFNMKSSCQTTKAKRSLFVFDFKSKQIKEKTYDVPCCCTCQITSSV